MFDYTDYIATRIHNTMAQDDSSIVHDTGPVQLDLHDEGYFLSSKKTIEIVDCNLRRVRVTIEMVEE